MTPLQQAIDKLVADLSWHPNVRVVLSRDQAEAVLKALWHQDIMLAALKEVEEWWLADGMQHHDGAPHAIFATRAAIARVST